jgi:hypothetical protein
MSHICTQEQFMRDVAKHEMIVIRDDGVNRHIRFKEPGTGNMHFDLITWPGCLCYTGDMGTYVFQRLTDMFEFFRTDRTHRRDPSKLAINLGYWTEKLIAIDGSRHGGKVKEFDEAQFKRVINEYRVQWMRNAKESGTLDKEGRRGLWEAVDDEVLFCLDDGSDRALMAAYDFSHNPDQNSKRQHGWQFDDLFEHDWTEYTHSIVWCCYALAWGVEQYDASKVTESEDQGVAA